MTVGARSVGTVPSQSVNRTLSGTVEPALTTLPSWNGGSRSVAVYSTTTSAVVVVTWPWLSVTVTVAV